jgi:hypothetical protein
VRYSCILLRVLTTFDHCIIHHLFTTYFTVYLMINLTFYDNIELADGSVVCSIRSHVCDGMLSNFKLSTRSRTRNTNRINDSNVVRGCNYNTCSYVIRWCKIQRYDVVSGEDDTAQYRVSKYTTLFILFLNFTST